VPRLIAARVLVALAVLGVSYWLLRAADHGADMDDLLDAPQLYTALLWVGISGTVSLVIEIEIPPGSSRIRPDEPGFLKAPAHAGGSPEKIVNSS
jgi:hypothetical protein